MATLMTASCSGDVDELAAARVVAAPSSAASVPIAALSAPAVYTSPPPGASGARSASPIEGIAPLAAHPMRSEPRHRRRGPVSPNGVSEVYTSPGSVRKAS